MTINPISAELKQKWITALLSGEYKQGRYVLCEVKFDGTKEYCCLGVLAEIAGMLSDGPVEENLYSLKDHPKRTGYLMTEIGDEMLVNQAMQRLLSSMNDDEHSFDRIAKVIEREVDTA